MSAESRALTHARLDDHSLYLKVFELLTAGHSSPEISKNLEMTPQSVNRLLKRYRRSLIRQPKVRDYLSEAAAKMRLPYLGHYTWLLENTLQMMREMPSELPGRLRACFSQCPLVEAPSRFTFAHVDIAYDPETFPFPRTPQLKEAFGNAGMKEVMERRGSCRHCPFGAGARNLAMLFEDAPDIYLDIQHYLACQRVRSDEEYYFHFTGAVLISWVRRIAMMRRMRAEHRGLSLATASRLETRMQNRITRTLFAIINEVPTSAVDKYGCFIYARGSGSGGG